MKRFLVFATVLTIVALACAPAFAFEFIVASRNTGPNFGNYSETGGWADSTGSSTAPGLGAGSRYSGTSTYFGPSRQALATFNPATTGYYDISLAWPSSGGEKQTAVTLYTGASHTSGTLDQWGNNGPGGVITAGTMDMYYRATNVWNKFTTAKLTTGTNYKVGVYGGYKAPNANENRVCVAGFMFTSVTPGAVTGGALNLDNELSWTAGANNSFFNVYFGESAETLSFVGTVDENTLSMGVDFDYLAPGTYYWKVDAGNVDLTTAGEVYSFTVAAVPEPGSMLALGTGLIGLLGVIRRKKS